MFMAKPLYEVPIELRKGTDLEDMTNEEDVINVVPFTDYASILYLNDDFEGGETFFEDGTVLKPKQGTCVIFESMKHFHGVYPHGNEDRYTSPIWYTSQPEQMELQSHGNTGTSGQWRGLIRNPDPSKVNVGIDSHPIRKWWADNFNIPKSSRQIGTSFCILNI